MILPHGPVYKFGHHFRVYCGKNVHSDLLVHAVEKDVELPMSAYLPLRAAGA